MAERPTVEVGTGRSETRVRTRATTQIHDGRPIVLAVEEVSVRFGGLLAVEWPQRLTLPPAGSWHLELSLLDPADPDAGRLGWLTPPSGA